MMTMGIKPRHLLLITIMSILYHGQQLVLMHITVPGDYIIIIYFLLHCLWSFFFRKLLMKLIHILGEESCFEMFMKHCIILFVKENRESN